MSKVKELFGVFASDHAGLELALSRQICPFSCKKCYKTRKSNPDIAIGTCTVHYQEDDIIICPSRLLENNQIFLDCLHLLTQHEPGNELYIIPEVSIPGGTVDFFLVSAKDGKVRDFAGIELQTLDTTGTIWPERQRLLHEHGFPVDRSDLDSRKSFGMNWKMTAKTILVQLHHKSQTFEHLNKHLVLIVQMPFFDYMRRAFSFSHIQGVRLGDPVHIHTYGLKETGNRLKLSLDTRVSTDSAGIAVCLGLHDQTRLELRELTAALEQKLCDQYRLSIV